MQKNNIELNLKNFFLKFLLFKSIFKPNLQKLVFSSKMDSLQMNRNLLLLLRGQECFHILKFLK